MSAAYDLRFDSGRLCLDLLATVGSRLSSAPVERLDGVPRLREWLAGSGLVPAGQPVAVEEDWLGRFQSVRALLHRVIHTELGGGRAEPADLTRLNDLVRHSPVARQVRRSASGELRVHLVEPVTCDALISAVAADTVQLLTGADRSDLRECAGDTCDLVYVDHSRGHRRRWCASAICGNRERVDRHRQRARVTMPAD